MRAAIASTTAPSAPDAATTASAASPADAITSVEAAPPARMRMPIVARGWALNVVGALAVIAALKIGSGFFVPLLCGILIAFVLDPLVDAMERHRVPRAIGATLVMTLMLTGMGWGIYAMYGPARALAEDIPRIVRKMSDTFGGNETGTLARLRAIVEETRRAAQGLPEAGQDATPSPPAPAARRRPPASTRGEAHAAQPAQGAGEGEASVPYQQWLWSSSMGMLTFAGQFGMVLFLVFFLLIAGDTFKRKLVKIAGPTFTQKKITVKILDDIDASIQRYMWVLGSTNLAIGVLTAAMLWVLDFDSAAGLGLAAGVLHVIPYAGPAITAVLLAVVGVIQFESVGPGLIAAAGSLVIATLVGMLVTTWMTGRLTRMNATAVFVSLLFFGWLWGAWGLMLGLPVIVMIKTIADHIEDMQALSELLSD